MNARTYILVFVLALGALALTQAAPDRHPTQSRAKAELVAVGKVHDLTFTRHEYGREGIHLRGLAEVIVTGVERGEGARIGEKLNIRWTAFILRPDRQEGITGEHVYRMKADDAVRFWLMRDGKDWKIIDHPDGVENLTER